MATPLTTPVCLAKLQAFANVPITANTEILTEESVNEFLGHLQTLSGVDENPEAYPLCYTAGLPAICSLWTTLIAKGGVDFLMASTAYGGSSELTDLLLARAETFKKHKFDITGKNDLSKSIQSGLDLLASDPNSLFPTTVLFVEIPTNPDMKVPEIEVLA